jgi:hypothetical protein
MYIVFILHGQKVQITKILLKRAVIGVVLIVFKGIISHVCTVTVLDMIDDFFWYLIHVEQTVRNGNSADMIDDSLKKN